VKPIAKFSGVKLLVEEKSMKKRKPTADPELTLADIEADRALFRALRPVLLRSERLWLLDIQGDYFEYRKRLAELTRSYRIKLPEEPGK